jgi:hypothetical protein
VELAWSRLQNKANTASVRSEPHVIPDVLARVVTRDLVVSQNKNFGRNPSWSYVKPVVTRGSTVLSVACPGLSYSTLSQKWHHIRENFIEHKIVLILL